MSVNNNLPCRVYKVLLVAYPSDFRREYGPSMLQVFRDRYIDEASRKHRFAIISYWMGVLSDLLVSASKEHSENLRKANDPMNNVRKDLLAVLGTAAIIVAAFMLLSYGRSHEVGSILAFGRILDALVVTGVVGNLIVFLLVKLTKWNPLRIATATFLVVSALLFALAAIVGSKVDPQFRFGALLLAYVVSAVFWIGLHWAWRSTTGNALVSS